MGTKNNPGKFDCYAAAGPDEPIFVLLGRDRHAPLLVRLWAILRHEEGEDPGKIAEALQIADEMEKELWRQNRTFVGGEDLLELATTSLSDHPGDYDGPCNCSECLSYQ